MKTHLPKLCLRGLLLIACVLELSFTRVSAQTNISGVINTYTAITGVNVPSNNVTVASTAGFAIGDTVLLIQMKGATMDQTDASTFGNITALNSAGGYEFAVICDISGFVVTFDQILMNTYSNTGSAQMVTVPKYSSANVTGTLTASTWNGTTGGVIVLWVYNTLTLNADINVSAQGFRAGAFQDWGMSCNCLSAQSIAYFYANPSNQGAQKGEGISATIAGKESGKGKQVSGGGGGNNHNAGGAGGGNYGAGGQGGNGMECSGFSSTCRGLNPGVGGLSLSSYISTQNRLYMGGGGGAGHYANGSAGSGTTPGGFGAEGAGIVIIVANTLNGNGRVINASGRTVPYIAYADAGGGGGAGGSVVLDVVSYSANPLTVQVNGGNGATHSWASSATNCRGPGGGGGGGVILYKGASLPGNVTVNVAGGLKGDRLGNLTCSPAAPFNEANGANGATLNNYARQMSSTDYSGCNLGPLPVTFSKFIANQSDNKVVLTWGTYEEENTSYFEVQRSVDIAHFMSIAKVPAKGGNGQMNEYTVQDNEPFSGLQYYRIRSVDRNGSEAFSETRAVTFTPASLLIAKVYPNPAGSGSSLYLEMVQTNASALNFKLTDAFGKQVMKWSLEQDQLNPVMVLGLPELPPGTYFLHADNGFTAEVIRVMISTKE